MALAVLAIAGTTGWFSLDQETRGLLATLPTNRDLLFWSQPQRDAAFRALDRLSVLAKSHVIQACSTPSPLPPGPPLKLGMDVDAFMAGQRSAAVLVLHDGKLRLERYGLDFDASGRWTSFSVAKSMTSTLVGTAIRDGSIKSMEQQATWRLSKTGQEISGCCIQAAARDYVRFGQGIFIDPKRKLVIATNAHGVGAARDPVAIPAREAFYKAVQKAVDEEAAAGPT